MEFQECEKYSLCIAQTNTRWWRQWVKQIGHKPKWDNDDVEIVNEKYDDEFHVEYSYCMKSNNSSYNSR